MWCRCVVGVGVYGTGWDWPGLSTHLTLLYHDGVYTHWAILSHTVRYRWMKHNIYYGATFSSDNKSIWRIFNIVADVFTLSWTCVTCWTTLSDPPGVVPLHFRPIRDDYPDWEPSAIPIFNITPITTIIPTIPTNPPLFREKIWEKFIGPAFLG